jgi:AraC-like DNA-binding protein
MTAIAFDPEQPLHRLAADFVKGLSQVIESVEPSVAERLSTQALDLIALAIAPSAARPYGSAYRSALLYRLKSHIHAHLADPNLSLSGTAAALGMSSRHVNNLLAAQGESFGRYVLARRLDQCRRNLADPSLAHRQISEIAFAWGFNDQSHFSRAFKHRFGRSPRDYRGSGAPI